MAETFLHHLRMLTRGAKGRSVAMSELSHRYRLQVVGGDQFGEAPTYPVRTLRLSDLIRETPVAGCPCRPGSHPLFELALPMVPQDCHRLRIDFNSSSSTLLSWEV